MGNFVQGWAGSLCAGDELTADSDGRQQGHGKDNNPHAAQPMGEGTPKQHGFWQRLNISENGGACGRKSRTGLKKGIDIIWYRAREPKWKCANQRGYQPA